MLIPYLEPSGHIVLQRNQQGRHGDYSEKEQFVQHLLEFLHNQPTSILILDTKLVLFYNLSPKKIIVLFNIPVQFIIVKRRKMFAYLFLNFIGNVKSSAPYLYFTQISLES